MSGVLAPPFRQRGADPSRPGATCGTFHVAWWSRAVLEGSPLLLAHMRLQPCWAEAVRQLRTVYDAAEVRGDSAPTTPAAMPEPGRRWVFDVIASQRRKYVQVGAGCCAPRWILATR